MARKYSTVSLRITEQRRHVVVRTHDTGQGRAQSRDALELRFERKRLFAFEPLELDPVGARRHLNRAQVGDLIGGSGNDELAAASVFDPVALTEVVQPIATQHTQL